jgi:hypothetical protein
MGEQQVQQSRGDAELFGLVGRELRGERGVPCPFRAGDGHAELQLHSNWALLGRFGGEFGDCAQTYTGTARVQYT